MTFFTSEFFIQLITSFITPAAFAIIFRVNRRHLVFIAICGALTYAAYYTLLFFTKSLFVAAFVSAMVTAIYAEIFARLRHAPTIIFVLTGIVPTVPGGSLYRGMRDLLLRNTEQALTHFATTLEVGIGIAGGIVAVPILLGIVNDFFAKRKKRKTEQK